MDDLTLEPPTSYREFSNLFQLARDSECDPSFLDGCDKDPFHALWILSMAPEETIQIFLPALFYLCTLCKMDSETHSSARTRLSPRLRARIDLGKERVDKILREGMQPILLEWKQGDGPSRSSATAPTRKIATSRVFRTTMWRLSPTIRTLL